MVSDISAVAAEILDTETLSFWETDRGLTSFAEFPFENIDWCYSVCDFVILRMGIAYVGNVDDGLCQNTSQ